jgi:hypothetical protein
MPAVWSRSREMQTWRGQPNSVEINPFRKSRRRALPFRLQLHDMKLTFLLQAIALAVGIAAMVSVLEDMKGLPTALGVICGILTVIGIIWIVPERPDGAIFFDNWDRLEMALCAGILIAYAVTYAIPAVA